MKIKQKEVVFFKLGGSWDLLEKTNSAFSKEGITNDMLSQDEAEYGLYGKDGHTESKAFTFARHINNHLEKVSKKQRNIHTRLRYIPEIKKLVKGNVIALFNVDSFRFYNIIFAPLVSFFLQYAWKNPTKIILGGHGCDTADVGLLPFLDVFTFDTNLPPIIFTGSNRVLNDPKIDAEINLRDIVRLTQAHLPSGAYWVFAGDVFQASDFARYDVATFYSPHFTSKKVTEVLAKNNEPFPRKNVIPKEHISQKITYKSLLEAMGKVKIIDSTMQEDISLALSYIDDSRYTSFIIGGYSSGHVPGPIYHACERAALAGKSIIITSNTLIGGVYEWDNLNLLGLNKKELRNTGKKIIPGHKLNRFAARALAIRAILENLNQDQTQKLFEKYALAKNLSAYDTIPTSKE